jgi:hypothetical protein
LAHFYPLTTHTKVIKIMQDKNTQVTPLLNQKEDDNDKQQKDSISKAKNDPSVKKALIKENSPTTPEDLSHLHNTIEIGTSGGDQRASEDEQSKNE